MEKDEKVTVREYATFCLYWSWLIYVVGHFIEPYCSHTISCGDYATASYKSGLVFYCHFSKGKAYSPPHPSVDSLQCMPMCNRKCVYADEAGGFDGCYDAQGDRPPKSYPHWQGYSRVSRLENCQCLGYSRRGLAQPCFENASHNVHLLILMSFPCCWFLWVLLLSFDPEALGVFLDSLNWPISTFDSSRSNQICWFMWTKRKIEWSSESWKDWTCSRPRNAKSSSTSSAASSVTKRLIFFYTHTLPPVDVVWHVLLHHCCASWSSIARMLLDFAIALISSIHLYPPFTCASVTLEAITLEALNLMPTEESFWTCVWCVVLHDMSCCIIVA